MEAEKRAGLWELFFTFAKIGALTFGGGYAMLPMLQREVVERKGWSTEAELMEQVKEGTLDIFVGDPSVGTTFCKKLELFAVPFLFQDKEQWEAALDGEPGVYSARYAAVNGAGEGHSSADNMALLLERLRGAANRRARFRTVIALILEGREYLFEGIVNGEITEERSGAEGFGYDPVFRPDGYAETFAEMPLELKNSISHRGRATAKLIEFLSAL